MEKVISKWSKPLFSLLALLLLAARAYGLTGEGETRYFTYVDGFYYAFYGNGVHVTCKSGAEYHSDGWSYIARSAGYSGNVAIPEKVVYDGVEYPVTGIATYAFYGCHIDTLTIPRSVSYIAPCVEGDIDCVRIDSWEWWNSIDNQRPNEGDYEDEMPFASLLGSRHVIVGGKEADMEHFTVPEGLGHLRQYAFAGCGMKTVTLPATLTEMGESAFEGCGSLERIDIPGNVTKMGARCFKDCTSLEEAHIGNGITRIPARTFYNVPELRMVSLGRNVEYMAYDAFTDFADPCKVIVGDLATWCERFSTTSGFQGNIRLFIDEGTEIADLVVPDGVQSIKENCFSGLQSLKSVTIPGSVKTIGQGAFSFCDNLTGVTIGNGVETVKDEAFVYCKSLASVTIGSSVKDIRERTFAGCDAIRRVVAVAKKPWPFTETENGQVFPDEVFRNAVLYVPIGSRDYYSRSRGWRNFLEIVETALGTGEDGKKCATPTIAYDNGRLVFSCETSGAECIYEIRCADTGTGRGSEVSLGQTYEIRIHATLDGWEDSDVAVATIGWHNGRSVMEGFSSVTLGNSDGFADVNGDGTVDVADIAAVISAMAGLPKE